MNNKAKKALKITSTVLTWIVITFTVFMIAFTIFSVLTLDRNERPIFGTRFYIVRSDSMSEPDNGESYDIHFNAGDLILIKNVEDKTSLKKGDVIAFLSNNRESYGETITHMIADVQYDANGRVAGYVTMGINTGTPDEKLVQPDFVIGQYKGKIPLIGRFFAFMRTTPGYICCIFVPFLLLIIYNAANVIVLFKKYKREQTEVLNAEKAQIEKEREENQRMMAELMALKAKLEENNKE